MSATPRRGSRVWQDRHRERTEALEKVTRQRNVEIFIGRGERASFHCFYSGSDDFVMHTSGAYLALAVAELARIRNRKKVTVRVTKRGFEVSAKPRKLPRKLRLGVCSSNRKD